MNHMPGKLPSLLFILLISSCRQNPDVRYASWRIKGGTADGIQYSSLSQINKQNVGSLQVAWIYSTRDADTGKELWKFEPASDKNLLGVNRGVTYWADGDDKRIFSSLGEYLYCLDAK